MLDRRLPRGLLGLAALKLLLHLLTNGQYGFHRDELYYIVGGTHLAWGYVDHPPLVPLLARLMTAVFGLSVPGLRLLPALAGALIVLLAGMLARELGGGRNAQLLAGLAVLLAPLFLGANTLFQTVTFDQLWWLLALYLFTRLLNGASPRLWLGLGVVLGLALLTKYTVALLVLGMVAGVLLTPLRQQLRTPWPWLGLAIAALLALPNVLWQISSGWPTLVFIRNNGAEVAAEQGRLGFLLGQPLLIGPTGLPLLIAGVVALWSRGGQRYRALGWVVAVVYGALLLTGGKAYYAGPLYPLLFAAGAPAAERWLDRRRPQLRAAALAALVALSLPPLSFTLPLLPAAQMASWGIYRLNGDFAEMLGWPELVSTVEQVAAQLPPDERERSVVLTGSYGEAAAIELLGAGRVPPPISGHNSYAYWSAARTEAETYIVLRYSEPRLRQWFQEVTPVATLSNALGVPNEAFGSTVYLCRRPIVPIAQRWPEIVHFN